MPDCTEKEVEDIFEEVSDMLIKESKNLSKEYGNFEIYKQDYISNDRARVRTCNIEIILNGSTYLYPGIELVTYR